MNFSRINSLFLKFIKWKIMIKFSLFLTWNSFFRFQVTNSLAAIAAGVSFGVFTLGMLFPWTNSQVIEFPSKNPSSFIVIFHCLLQGAFVGGLVGFLIAGWASLGANAAIGSGLIVPQKLPVPTDHCTANVSESFLKQFEHSKYVLCMP